jgi:hypothetical protein
MTAATIAAVLGIVRTDVAIDPAGIIIGKYISLRKAVRALPGRRA